MNLTNTLISLTKSFEGCKLEAYQDIGGVWTIGYGHTGLDVNKGLIWTQDQADQNLINKLTQVQIEIKSFITNNSCTQNQLDALTDFAYNLGINALKNSTLLKYFNNNDVLNASKEFLKWDHDNGKVVPGLLSRRLAEQHLFLNV